MLFLPVLSEAMEAGPEVGSAVEQPQQPIVPVASSVTYKDPGSCIQRDAQTGLVGWVDSAHCVFSWRANATARWVDDWFGDWGSDASTFVALQQRVGWTEVDKVYSRRLLHAHMDLPNAKRRFRLVVTNEQEDSALVPGASNVGQPPSSSSAAVRWVALVEKALRMDLDLGVRSGPEAFVRGRLEDNIGFGASNVLKLRQLLRYGVKEKGYSFSGLDVEHLLDENSIFRFANAATWRETEKDAGFQWGQGMSLSHQFQEARSLSYGVSVFGVSRPEFHTSGWGPNLVYRQKLWRPWIFVEIEPAYTKRMDLQGQWVSSLEGRIEFQFGK